MLKEAGQLCKATDPLPLYVLEGRQGRNSSKFAAAHLQELYRQENKLSSLSDTCHTAWSVSKGTTFLYPLTASCGPSIKMNQAQQPTLAWHKHRPVSPTWHGLSTGKDTALCEHGCAAFRDGFTPKSRFLCRRHAVIPSQKPCPEFDATHAWAHRRGCGRTYYRGAHSTTSVNTKVSAWASVSHQTAEPVAAEAEDCKTTATTSASMLHSPVLLSESCVSSESSRAAFEPCPSCEHWGAQSEYPQLP